MSTDKPTAGTFLSGLRAAQDQLATEQMAHAIMASPVMMGLVAESVALDFQQAVKGRLGEGLRSLADQNPLAFRLQATVTTVGLVAKGLRDRIALQAKAASDTSRIAAALAKWEPGGEPQ